MYWLRICCAVSLSLIAESQSEDFISKFDDEGRIVGGEPADIIDIPYQLSLRKVRNNEHCCGASIFSSKWAISAAHCFKTTKGWMLVAGATFQSNGGSKHKVDKVVLHPLWNEQLIDNDIAVVRVKQPFPLGSRGVNCIKLAYKSPAIGTSALTSGWGQTQEMGDSPDQLQKVLVPIVSNYNCNKPYHNQITDSMLCAGYAKGGKDACQGDSGGPLVIGRQLVGIVSWGYGCARDGVPGVYTRVDKFYNWVQNVTGGSNCKHEINI